MNVIIQALGTGTLALFFIGAIWLGAMAGKKVWIWFWWRYWGYRGCCRSLTLHAEMEARRVQ